MNTKQSFVRKSVFVGIDVHKTTYSVCIVCESETVCAKLGAVKTTAPSRVRKGHPSQSSFEK
jgi:hypothetical protein